jgi:hypothetical protein
VCVYVCIVLYVSTKFTVAAVGVPRRVLGAPPPEISKIYLKICGGLPKLYV